MRILRLVSLICLPLSLFAQPSQGRWFRVGFTGGVPLMNANANKTTAQGVGTAGIHWDRYAVGVSFEAYLNDHISVEFNPLHRRTTANQTLATYNPATGATTTTLNGYENYVIDLPVIGKYTFGEVDANWRPFAGAGFAFNTALQTVNVQTAQQFYSGRPAIFVPQSSYNQWAPWDTGAVFDAGVRFRLGWAEFSPELRYTRWGGANLTHSRNQPEFLLSVRF